MFGSWHHAVLLAICVSAACERSPEPATAAQSLAADGGEPPLDASAPSSDIAGRYNVCDGSDEIRFAVWAEAGASLDEGYAFEHAHGYPSLYVDGHCEFVAARYLQPPGKLFRGHFSAQFARNFELNLDLTSLPSGAFPDPESCPDPGTVKLATATFYGECSCGCDPSAPAELEATVLAFADFMKWLDKAETVSSDVEVAAIKLDSADAHSSAAAWPFAWSVTEIVNASLAAGVEPKLRVLHGEDAEHARKLRNEADARSQDKRLLLESGGDTYRLFVRDRIEPAFAAKLERYRECAPLR